MARILIVEDERHLAAGLEYNLKAEGYDPEIVDSGEQALARFDAEPNRYDLAILDVMPPGLDGLRS
jgi:DNA-binding response OmpR family regulator